MLRWCTGIAAVLMAGCGSGRHATILDAVPVDSTAVALIDLNALRASGSLSELPAPFAGPAGQLGQARELAAIWNGKDLLLISAGDSAQAPGGYTSIGHGIAAAGPADRIEAARSALAEGKSNARDLPAGDAQVRVVVRGDGRLPLTGNLANLTRLLRMADTTTIALRIRSDVEVDIVGRCRSPQQAQRLEESIRAVITMATSFRGKDQRLAALLQSVRVTRESGTVRIHGAGPAEAIRRLF